MPANGDRLVFHGTRNGFSGFDNRPAFFTSVIEVARGYASRSGPRGVIVVVRLRLTNPVVLDFLAPNTPRWYENKRRIWMNKGYDGAVIGGDVFIAFSPAQIEVVEQQQL
jgi:hypothetical protein